MIAIRMFQKGPADSPHSFIVKSQYHKNEEPSLILSLNMIRITSNCPLMKAIAFVVIHTPAVMAQSILSQMNFCQILSNVCTTEIRIAFVVSIFHSIAAVAASQYACVCVYKLNACFDFVYPSPARVCTVTNPQHKIVYFSLVCAFIYYMQRRKS